MPWLSLILQINPEVCYDLGVCTFSKTRWPEDQKVFPSQRQPKLSFAGECQGLREGVHWQLKHWNGLIRSFLTQSRMSSQMLEWLMQNKHAWAFSKIRRLSKQLNVNKGETYRDETQSAHVCLLVLLIPSYNINEHCDVVLRWDSLKSHPLRSPALIKSI